MRESLDEAKALETRLILAVAHLCERTRNFASGGRLDALGLAPVEEALLLVQRTLGALQAEADARAAPGGLASEEQGSWLLNEAEASEWRG